MHGGKNHAIEMGNLLEKPGMARKIPAWWEKKRGR
jgi:hypothetical protein